MRNMNTLYRKYLKPALKSFTKFKLLTWKTPSVRLLQELKSTMFMLLLARRTGLRISSVTQVHFGISNRLRLVEVSVRNLNFWLLIFEDGWMEMVLFLLRNERTIVLKLLLVCDNEILKKLNYRIERHWKIHQSSASKRGRICL